MTTMELAVTCCCICAGVCMISVLVNVKLFTEWVKHGILKK